MKINRRIALIAVNSRSSHTNLALYYIKKLLTSYSGIEYELIELTINENWKQSLEKLTEKDFSHYIFSVYIWNSTYVEQLAGMIKKVKPEGKIILGGPEVSYNIKKWDKMGIADVLVQGQAEAYIKSIFGFNKGVFISHRTPINDIPFPYEKEDYINLKGRLVYYEASRGCLFNCSYCLSSCSDQKLEYRDLETVKKELLQLIAIKPKIVKMVDRTFNSNKKFAREIWQFIIDQNSPVPFHFELHPAFLEEADYNILKKAPNNLFHFEVGIQSTDKEVLKAVDRPFNWNIEKGNIEKLCSIKNIHTHLDQIVALPCDNRKTAINSFNEILSLKPDEFQLGFLKVLPGTKLASTCSENSLTVNPFPPYEVIETASMDFKTIKEFYAIERTLNRFYNSHFFKTTLGFLLGQDITPWEFFSILTEMAPDDQAVKRWPVLGETLLNYGRKYLPEDSDYIKDLLKYDWCPYAPAQTYPPFLRENDGDKIKDSRRTAFDYFSGNYEDFKRSEFNRSILYIPDTERFAKKLGDKAILFYRGHNKKELEIDLSVLNS